MLLRAKVNYDNLTFVAIKSYSKIFVSDFKLDIYIVLVCMYYRAENTIIVLFDLLPRHSMYSVTSQEDIYFL